MRGRSGRRDGNRHAGASLVDDHRMFRTGVRAEIGATTRRGRRRGRRRRRRRSPSSRATRPEVVLLDVHLPGGGGVEVLARACSARLRTSRFLALSVSDAAEDVIGVIRGGARGYVTKTITGTDLVDADPPGRRRRRRVLAAAGRLRARRVRRRPTRRRSTPTSTGSPSASARCCG